MKRPRIAANDTDRKQGNVMNSNPNRHGSGKERQMHATIRTTSVAVLVALGLALTTWAAEAPSRFPVRPGFRCM